VKLDFTLIEGVARPAIMPNMAQIDDLSSHNYPTQINGTGKTFSFLYDAYRNRYRQTYTSSGGTETTHYAGGVVNSTGTDWRHYVNVGGQVVAVVSRHSNGTNLTRYMLEDQQGSPSNILNANGTSFVQEAFLRRWLHALYPCSGYARSV
jgi:hypothetical protein